VLTDGDDDKPEMTCGGIDGSQRPPRAVLARQHWVDVLVNNVGLVVMPAAASRWWERRFAADVADVRRRGGKGAR
jgi:hypothetical protein